jgi:hypothetical protein
LRRSFIWQCSCCGEPPLIAGWALSREGARSPCPRPSQLRCSARSWQGRRPIPNRSAIARIGAQAPSMNAFLLSAAAISCLRSRRPRSLWPSCAGGDSRGVRHTSAVVAGARIRLQQHLDVRVEEQLDIGCVPSSNDRRERLPLRAKRETRAGERRSGQWPTCGRNRPAPSPGSCAAAGSAGWTRRACALSGRSPPRILTRRCPWAAPSSGVAAPQIWAQDLGRSVGPLPTDRPSSDRAPGHLEGR